MTYAEADTVNSKKTQTSTDAIKLLIEDHEKVKALFQQFKKLKDGESSQKAALVREICNEISVHVLVEEELFYPALRKAIDDELLMDEADVEHNGAKNLVAQLRQMKPGDDYYDATVIVLGEYIDHHVKEEQEEMFPKAKKTDLDMVSLGKRMLEHKKNLQSQLPD